MWKDIEGAPRDGTDLLLWVGQQRHGKPPVVIAGYFDNGDSQGWASPENEDEWILSNPTHWQPLPTPPKGAGDE